VSGQFLRSEMVDSDAQNSAREPEYDDASCQVEYAYGADRLPPAQECVGVAMNHTSRVSPLLGIPRNCSFG